MTNDETNPNVEIPKRAWLQGFSALELHSSFGFHDGWKAFYAASFVKIRAGGRLRHHRGHLAGEAYANDTAPGAHARRGVVQCRHVADHASGGAGSPRRRGDGDARHRSENAKGGRGGGSDSGIG